MNCDAARRRLLADEHPDRPTDDGVRRHLAACSACRALARRLAQVEGRIPHLPVPPSSAKAVFVRRFLRAGGPVVRRVPLSWPTPVKERGLKKLSLAVAIAGVLAVFAIGLWSWRAVPNTPRPAEDPLVAQVRKQRDQIRTLPEPGDRVTQAAALAANLRARARALAQAGDADGLNSLAGIYGEVVVEDLGNYARAVPAPQRAVALRGLDAELRDAESEFSRLKAEAPNSSTAGPLGQLASSAGAGGRTIQWLLKAA
jgi:hypothetical protein